jgi:hypothetical protein
MLSKIRRPSPSLVVAVIALFVGLSGTAVAASPIVKRALYAENAGKLQKRTVVQLASMPSPASTAAGLLTTKTASDTIGANAGREYVISCDGGKKIVSGGFSSSGNVWAADSRPTSDTTWSMYLANFNENASASVTLHAICLG